jgi:hypothetical protein
MTAEDVLAGYRAWLEERRYSRGTIGHWVSTARRVIDAYAGERIPSEDRDRVADAVVCQNLTSKSRHAQRTAVNRFCEYLEDVRGEA